MKRIFATVITLLILFTSTTYAESIGIEPIVIHDNFSIRNGIGYGTTLDEAKESEEKLGTSSSYDKTLVEWLLAGKYRKVYSTILSNKEVYLGYYTNEDNTIRELQYLILDSGAELKDALTKKYGNSNFHHTLLPGLDTRTRWFTSITKGISDYAGWLIKYDDCWVVVEYVVNSFSSSKFSRINYCIIPDEEMQLYIGLEETSQFITQSSI